jgi:pSer/pThr/pTyr-binding forkhead associated (FHA) protein
VLQADAPTKVIDASPKPAPPAQESFGTLHVGGGPLAGNRFPIPKAGLLIGRDPTRCTVVLADESISKEHAWVVPLDNGVAVIDRNSANGTFVNSTDSPRINKVVLRHGDRVFLGKNNGTVFTYYNA